MHTVIFTPSARAEFIAAHDWYEREVSGFGREFQAEIDRLVERMSDNPWQFPIVYKNVRRALLRRFPYALFFVVDDAVLLVIACFHASRDPAHWQGRS